MDGAAEHYRLARGQNGDLIKKALSLPWNDALEMVDVVGVLQSVGKEVGALADDRRADFAWPLAGDDERKTELSSLLGNAFECFAGKRLATIFHLTRGARIVVGFFKHENPRVEIALACLQPFATFQQHPADSCADKRQRLMRHHRKIENRTLEAPSSKPRLRNHPSVLEIPKSS